MPELIKRNMKKLILFLSISAAVFIILFLAININSEYILTDTKTDDWNFLGGRISVNGTKREFQYYGIEYIGSDELKINKITVELRAYNIFSKSRYDVLSLSSIGGDQQWTIDDNFDYGAGEGKTHAIEVLKTYFLSKAELRITLADHEKTETVLMEISAVPFKTSSKE